MANPEHVAILKSGVDHWNQWRGMNPKIVPDLSDLNAEKQFPRAMPPSEMRSRQVSTLLRAKTIEQQAVDALRKAI